MFYQERNTWNPWQELDRLQNEVTRLFRQGAREQGPDTPTVNVWVGEEGAWVSALLPGVQPDSLDVSVLGETLTIRGRRDAQPLKEKENYHRRERQVGEFARTVQLPFRVDTQKVAATFKHGLLEVMLPHASDARPRRITVKGVES